MIGPWVIDYNEIPSTSRARSVWLMVDGKEAGTGIGRSSYMSTVFDNGGKKYCCVVGTMLAVLFLCGLVLIQGGERFLIALVLGLASWLCACCICDNWCGRAGHYRNTPDFPFHANVDLPQLETSMLATTPEPITVISPTEVVELVAVTAPTISVITTVPLTGTDEQL